MEMTIGEKRKKNLNFFENSIAKFTRQTIISPTQQKVGKRRNKNV